MAFLAIHRDSHPCPHSARSAIDRLPQIPTEVACGHRRVQTRSRTLLLMPCLVFALLGCESSKEGGGDQASSNTVAETHHGTRGPELLSKAELAVEVTAQKRVAKYFHDNVTPRLKSCWGSLKGTGDIRMEYTFARQGKNWVPEKVILAHSTVPEDQNDAALKCMQGAVQDVPLPINSSDADTKEFFISWSWPVPTGKDAEKQYQAMLVSTGGGGRGGCDGRGTLAKCKRCVSSGASSCCQTVCVGYQSCSMSYSNGKLVGCFNDPPTQCVSGGAGGGLSSGVIMF